MDDKSSGLEALRINRPPTARTPKPVWFLGFACAVATLGLAAGDLWEAADAPARTDPAPPPIAVSVQSESVLDASGYVVARRQATVSSKITGKLIAVLIEEGQAVKEGQVLARLDAANATVALEQAKARVAQAEANLDAAQLALADGEPSYVRSEDLFRRGIISAENVEAARTAFNGRRMAARVQERTVAVERASLAAAQQNLEDTVVRAPFSGVVTEKTAAAGEMISPASTGGFTRTGICTIVDMESLEVEIDVSETFISRVRTGLPVTVRLNAYPDLQIPSRVLAVIPTADRAKATVKVRVAFDATDPRIVPEMGAHVSFLRRGTLMIDASSHPAVSLRNIVKSYTRGRQRIQVLDGLNLEVSSGEFLALMGPSGSGKTTILNLIAGLDRPDEGEVAIAGERIDRLRDGKLASWRARHVGFVFQFYNLLPMLSAARNVELPLLLTPLAGSERRKRALVALGIVGLDKRAAHKPDELSGGEQQRVAIARAIVADPTIVVCDEPTGDLDRKTADEILGLLKALNETQNKTIVIVTHDPKAAGHASRQLHVDKGKLVSSDAMVTA